MPTNVGLCHGHRLQDGKNRNPRLQIQSLGRASCDAGQQPVLAHRQLHQGPRPVACAQFRHGGGQDVQRRQTLGAAARQDHILRRDPQSADAGDPNYQLSQYLAGNLPEDVEIWSKAGHNLWTGEPKTSWYKHDMLRAQAPSGRALTVVAMTQGRGMAETFPQAFPAMGRLIWDMCEGMLDG